MTGVVRGFAGWGSRSVARGVAGLHPTETASVVLVLMDVDDRMDMMMSRKIYSIGTASMSSTEQPHSSMSLFAAATRMVEPVSSSSSFMVFKYDALRFSESVVDMSCAEVSF